MSVTAPASPSRLAALAAGAVRDAFTTYRACCRGLTQRARASFEQRDWASVERDRRARLALYRGAVDDAERALRSLLGPRVEERLVWVATKAVYSALVDGRQDWELAETFFNSVSRRIFSTVGVDPLVEFVESDFEGPPAWHGPSCVTTHACDGDTTALVAAILQDAGFHVPFEALGRDAALVATRIEAAARGPVRGAEMLRPTFFRGMGAFLVGRLICDGSDLPFVLALHNRAAGLYVDAVLLDEADVSMLFGFTRNAFSVDTVRPYDVVRFLHGLLPRKRVGELYIAIGEPKQGKTELYRDLLHHCEHGGERFVPAPGTAGLVMVVFTLPHHSHVLKVIRDRFPPQKETSPELVRARYRWVYAQDRAGRIVDAQCFEHLKLPRRAFDDALLDHLLSRCGRTVRVEGDAVVLDLAYVERKVTPLDLYLRSVDEAEARRVVVEYGRAIADLARCGIFPGDLLTKNFGVTRHGRVAFYDYDEVLPLSEVRFRRMPHARTPEDETRDGAWFSVDPGDVFPEEFPRFLGLAPSVRRTLLRTCAGLFDPSWWREVQAEIAREPPLEFAAYPDARRLPEPWRR